jgi:peptide/nickel transport system substrate-binding protein
MVKRLRFYLAFARAFLKRDRKKITYAFIFILLAVFAAKILFPTFGPKIAFLVGEFRKPTFIEGVVGNPTHPNPIFDSTETQKDISSLVYRGLMKINEEGKLEPDLAEKFEKVSKTEYTFYLRQGVYWHDGEKFTADDVVHTIQTAKDPQINSPLASNFDDVVIEKIDDYKVKFTLEEPFTPFPYSATVRIIPEHISLKKFEPVGTGQFIVKEINNEEIVLSGERLNLWFRFFEDIEAAEAALKLGEIHSLAGISPQGAEALGFFGGKVFYTNPIPFRQALAFFNTRSNSLKNKDVRQALSHSIDKKELIKKIGGQGSRLSTCQLFLKSVVVEKKERYPYNLEKSKKLLEETGYKFEAGKWKNKEGVLSVTITGLDDPELNSIVNFLQEAWNKLGLEVETKLVDGDSLRNKVLQNGDFQVLVNFQEISPDPDQYVLWHTTQAGNANITGIRSTRLDKILEDARKTPNGQRRDAKYKLFTNLLVDEAPVIFLYYPQFAWVVSNKVSGIDLSDFAYPSDRFNSVQNWKVNRKFF